MVFFDIFKINQFKQDIQDLTNERDELNTRLRELKADDYFQVQQKVKDLEKEYQHISQKNLELNSTYSGSKEQLNNLSDTGDIANLRANYIRHNRNQYNCDRFQA